MKIASCGNCGVLLDLDVLTFPDIELEEGGIDTAHAYWDGTSYFATAPCPVCKEPILKTGEHI